MDFWGETLWSFDDCLEEIYRFESERDAGEFKNIRNLPALLTKRLQDLKDTAK